MYGGEEGYEGEGGYEDEEAYEGEDGAEGEDGEIDLEGRVMLETAITRMDETSLELFYRVTNGLDHPILLTTPLPRVDADAIRPDPQRVYVYVDPEGVLQITKRLWPVPDDVEVVFPEVPFLTEVVAGGTFEENITLNLPIDVNYPYSTRNSHSTPKISITPQHTSYSIEYQATPENQSSSPSKGRKNRTRNKTTNIHILQGAPLTAPIPIK